MFTFPHLLPQPQIQDTISSIDKPLETGNAFKQSQIPWHVSIYAQPFFFRLRTFIHHSIVLVLHAFILSIYLRTHTYIDIDI